MTRQLRVGHCARIFAHVKSTGQPENTMSHKVAGLRARATADPWDAGAWEELASEVLNKSGNPDVDRAFYEDILAQFPSSVCPCRSARFSGGIVD